MKFFRLSHNPFIIIEGICRPIEVHLIKGDHFAIAALALDPAAISPLTHQSLSEHVEKVANWQTYVEITTVAFASESSLLKPVDLVAGAQKNISNYELELRRMLLTQLSFQSSRKILGDGVPSPCPADLQTWCGASYGR